MRINWTLIFFITISLIQTLSCSEKNKSNNDLQSNWVNISEITLNLDRYTSPVEEYSQYIPSWKGEESFAMHVRGKDQIKIYNLRTGNLADSLKIETDGPNSFRGIYDFHILNEDSIFLNQRYAYRMFLVNQNFDIINTFSFLPEGVKLNPKSGIPTSGENFLTIFNNKRNIFQINKKKIIVLGSPDKDFFSKEYYDTQSLILSKDVFNNETKSILGYPNWMKNKVWGTFHSFVYSAYNTENNTFVVSYAADEKLYIVDRDFKVIKKFAGGGSPLKEIRPMNQVTRDPKGYSAYLFGMPIYGPIYYDEFKKLYYRIGGYPIADYEDIVPRDPLNNPRDLVIMAFDTNGNKVAEETLRQSEEGIYLDIGFVNKEGLNLTYVDLQQEDKLVFKTFSVK